MELDLFAAVPIGADATEAAEALDESHASFLVIESEGVPQTVLDRAAAVQLTGPVAADHTPGLVVLDDPSEIGLDELRWLGLALQAAHAPGAIVRVRGEVAGILSARWVASGLAHVGLGTVRYGLPNTPARAYVCKRCSPPTRRRPPSGPDAPLCPRNLLHGPMQAEL